MKLYDRRLQREQPKRKAPEENLGRSRDDLSSLLTCACFPAPMACSLIPSFLPGHPSSRMTPRPPIPWPCYLTGFGGRLLLPRSLNSIERSGAEAPSLHGMDFGKVLWLSCNKCERVLCARARLERNIVISANTPEAQKREQGSVFMPKFDASGLLTAVVTDSRSNEVLMVGFMDAEALAKTRETGLAHFHSRSRGRLWMKGETSGHTLAIEEILVDCDQDALVLRAIPAGPACHTGEISCFYRKLEADDLQRVSD